MELILYLLYLLIIITIIAFMIWGLVALIWCILEAVFEGIVKMYRLLRGRL